MKMIYIPLKLSWMIFSVEVCTRSFRVMAFFQICHIETQSKMTFILKNGDKNIYPSLIKMLAVDWSMTSAYKTHAPCSYLRSVTGSLYVAIHVKLTSSQSALHATRRREDKILEKFFLKRPFKYRKHN